MKNWNERIIPDYYIAHNQFVDFQEGEEMTLQMTKHDNEEEAAAV